MKKLIFTIASILLLSACAPHPGSGIWQAADENSMGIKKVTLSFDGKAEFVSQDETSTTWHCFWSASSKQAATLTCTPSTNKDDEQMFVLTVNDDGTGEFSQNDQLIGQFTRQSGNPSIK